MRLFRIGAAIALALAAVSPSALMGPAAAAAKPGAAPITKEQRAKGMADGPALIQASGVDCQLADARFIGDSTDPKTKVKSAFYELACTNGEGVILDKTADPAPAAFTCMEVAAPGPDGKPNSLQCVLPGNADPKAGLLPYIAKSGKTCTPDKVRPIGHSATKTVFELACHEGPGFVLVTSSPPRLDKDVELDPCISFDQNGSIKCELTDRAAQLAVVDQLAAKSGKPCVVKDRAYIGATKDGSNYFEVACQDGKGYVLEQAANGSLEKTIDCANADFLNGGCKLSDARQAKTEQAGLYTQLAKKAGFNCDVAGYAPFSINVPGKEVVELTCSNRPDGAVAVFAATAAGSVFYDCAHSELVSFRCSLSKPEAAYSSLTAELKALGKNSCVVSKARMVGITADRHGYTEVACADGLQGYMIEYTLDPITPKATILCAEAKGIAGGCSLPGNKKA
jgi:hypothetical protein